jgi:hypothetical protein
MRTLGTNVFRLRMKPLKKTLVSSTSMVHCTAWLSVCEIEEMTKP